MDDILRPAMDLADGSSLPLHTLYAQVKGRIVRPEHPDYDDTRSLAHTNWDRKPAFIVRVEDTEDIAATLRYAQQHNLEVAIRSGGHSTCGHGSCDGGVVIDLRKLNTLTFAEDNSWAWAGAGLTAGEVTSAVEKRNMIVGFGDAATVGIGGLTLGGGIGYLVRKHGLTIDSLLAVEVVTATGDVLIADAHHHADLFWALRGGGGNFGVVTRFKYKLHPLPEFTGGPLILPATPEVLSGFVAAAKAAPEELSTIVMVMPAPPMPFLPEHMIGQTVIVGMMAFAGPASEAEKALAPFRELAEPFADLAAPAPYSSMYMPEDPNLKLAVSIRTLFMDDVDLKQAGQMLDLLSQNDAPIRMLQVRVLGGAAARMPVDATAFAHRQSQIMTAFLAIGDPDTLPRNDEWAENCYRAVEGSCKGAYVNFLANESTRIKEAYPRATLARLRQVKRQYDPHNLFHLNQNIAPAEDAA